MLENRNIMFRIMIYVYYNIHQYSIKGKQTQLFLCTWRVILINLKKTYAILIEVKELSSVVQNVDTYHSEPYVLTSTDIFLLLLVICFWQFAFSLNVSRACTFLYDCGTQRLCLLPWTLYFSYITGPTIIRAVEVSLVCRIVKLGCLFLIIHHSETQP